MLLLHTLVPHSHVGDIEAMSQKHTFTEAESLIDFIQVLFLTDLGEGHMENFKSGNGLAEISPQIIDLPFFDNFILETETLEISTLNVVESCFSPPDGIPLKATSPYDFKLRGPPSQSC